MNERSGAIGSGGLNSAVVEIAGWLAEAGAKGLEISDGTAVRALPVRRTDLPRELREMIDSGGVCRCEWNAGGMEIQLTAEGLTVRAVSAADAESLVQRVCGSETGVTQG